MAKKRNIHYVNNKDFSQAVVDYCTDLGNAKKSNSNLPIVPDYIAQCFLKIAEGLSHKSNFIRYTYREEMVMDAVENCLKAIENYDIKAATRTGNPNAFAYFTQITWYAFLRRIAKEKKQQDIKMKYIKSSGIEEYIYDPSGDQTAETVVRNFVDTLKDRIDDVKARDSELKEFVTEEKKKQKKIRRNSADSDLSEFL